MLSGSKTALIYAKNNEYDNVRLKYHMNKEGFSVSSVDDSIFRAISRSYFSSRDFLDDNGSSSSDSSANVRSFIHKISPLRTLAGTTYLPNIRFITEQGHEPKQFAKSSFPGHTVAFGKVIDNLARMDRPPFEDMDEERERLRQICDFFSFLPRLQLSND